MTGKIVASEIKQGNARRDDAARPGWMRRDEAARYCKISPRCLSLWQSRRLVPFVKVSHRVCLFKAADLDKALSRLTVKAVGES